jgi:tetratricopeptide (TPR) repeat protein
VVVVVGTAGQRGNAATVRQTLDPGDAMAHVVLGGRLLYGSDFDGAAAEFAAAQGANHNDAHVLALVAGYSNWLEVSRRPLALLERATRLDPSNSGTLPMVMPVYYFARDYEKTISKFMSRTNLGFFDFLYLAMSHAQLGQTDQALAAADLALEANPLFSAEWGLTHNGPFAPAAAASRALSLDGVDKAGLPLCATWEQLAQEVDVRQLPECEARRAMMLHGFSPMTPDRRQRRSRAAGSRAPSPP